MRYSKDPRWITAKYTSQCHCCKKEIGKNKPAFYYPATKTIFCADEACGQTASRDFAVMREYEEQQTN
jgi:hypothetical protein